MGGRRRSFLRDDAGPLRAFVMRSVHPRCDLQLRLASGTKMTDVIRCSLGVQEGGKSGLLGDQRSAFGADKPAVIPHPSHPSGGQ